MAGSTFVIENNEDVEKVFAAIVKALRLSGKSKVTVVVNINIQKNTVTATPSEITKDDAAMVAQLLVKTIKENEHIVYTDEKKNRVHIATKELLRLLSYQYSVSYIVAAIKMLGIRAKAGKYEHHLTKAKDGRLRAIAIPLRDYQKLLSQYGGE